jgi:hypothetical protein
LLDARSKTGAKHKERVPPTETHKRGIGPAQKTHRKGHRKMASIDHIDSPSLPSAGGHTEQEVATSALCECVSRGAPNAGCSARALLM